MHEQQKKSALVVGATGLIGSELLRLLVDSQYYQQIIVLVRRPEAVAVESDKITILTFDSAFNEALQGYPSIDDFYCALGTTQRKSGKRGLHYVDKELVINSAEIAKNNGATTASIVSAVGVSADSPFFYNRIKGEMEQGVEALGFERLIFWQPSVLIGERDEFRLGEEIAARLLAFPVFGNYQALPGKRVARAMFTATPNSHPGVVRHRVCEIKQFSN